MSESEYSALFLQWENARECVLDHLKTVTEPRLVIPFGVVSYNKTKEIQYVGLMCAQPQAILHALAPDEQARAKLRTTFIQKFANKKVGLDRFSESLEQGDLWKLCEISIAFANGRHGSFTHEYLGAEPYAISKRSVGPLLNDWFADWKKEIKDFGKVWLANGTADASGHLVFDARLGIHLPEGFNPVKRVSVEIVADNEADKVAFGRWEDLCPYLPEERHSHVFWPRDDKDPYSVAKLAASARTGKDRGYKGSSSIELSPSLARAKIEKEAAQTGCRVVSAADFPEAPQPPAGVERWFLIPEASSPS